METHAVKRWAGAAAVIMAAWSMGGCQTGLYDWGSYNASVTAMYKPAGMESAEVGKQIQAIQTEINATEAGAKANMPSRVPPGKYAHLGYLYAIQGDKVEARRCFAAEKQLSPESTKFVDVLLVRLK